MTRCDQQQVSTFWWSISIRLILNWKIYKCDWRFGRARADTVTPQTDIYRISILLALLTCRKRICIACAKQYWNYALVILKLRSKVRCYEIREAHLPHPAIEWKNNQTRHGPSRLVPVPPTRCHSFFPYFFTGDATSCQLQLELLVMHGTSCYHRKKIRPLVTLCLFPQFEFMLVPVARSTLLLLSFGCHA